VRDTTDRTGPVLRFTPAAWRRFADQAKQSLASRLRLLQAYRGCPRAWEWPLRRPRVPWPLTLPVVWRGVLKP
jgi:hypothetical protein